MGGSESKSSVYQENNITMVNDTTISTLNETINTAIVNSTINTASSCSGSVQNIQRVDIGGITIEAGGRYEGGVTQDITSYLNFDCVQATDVRNTVSNELIAQIMEELEKTTDTDVMQQLNAVADSWAQTQSLPLSGGSSSTSDVETINNYEQYTTTNVNLENVVRNSFESNFTSNNMQSCITTVQNLQEVDVGGIVVGEDAEAIYTVEQNIASDTIISCLQTQKIANDVTNQLAETLDITVKTTDTTKVAQEAAAEATAAAESTGLIQDFGYAIGNVFEPFTDAFSDIFGDLGEYGTLIAGASVFSSSSSSCLCCLVILAIVGFAIMSMVGGGGAGGAGGSGMFGGKFELNVSTPSPVSPMSELFY